MRAYSCLFITLLLVCHPQLWAQALTTSLPPEPRPSGLIVLTAAGLEQPGDAAPENLPEAQPVAEADSGYPVKLEAREQRRTGSVYTLTGEVEIHYRFYVLHADQVTYDEQTGEAVAEGRVQLDGGADEEHIAVSHARLNLRTQAAEFNDVIGTIGVHRSGSRVSYSNANPFAFSGRLVIKDGPQHYRIYDGKVTSCRIPRPNWAFATGRASVAGNQARIFNTRFELLGVPVFYLPYASHSVDAQGRQSGLLLPTFGTSSTKGTILGESYYWAINRSMDVTVGAEYYSLRGWAEQADFRYRGRDSDFFHLRYKGLQDRGLNGVNQGGAEVTLSARRDLDEHTRAIAQVDYLSSYIYREAFTEDFNQAVSSGVKSTAFITHSAGGFSETALFDRFQSFQSTSPGDEIRILHLPSVELNSADHSLGSWLNGRLMYTVDGSIAGLSRTEPGFQTSRLVARVDVHPELSLPLVFAGWTIRPSVGVRDTFYSKSQSGSTVIPTQRDASTNRGVAYLGLELRPPTLVRDFNNGLRHAIELNLHYRRVQGADDLDEILRIDPVDTVADTSELEYSLTQRLYWRRPHRKPCAAGIASASPLDDAIVEANPASPECGNQTTEWLSWQVAQKRFFNPSFGNAVMPGRRNVFETTLDFSGVAFVTESRYASPVISRLRLRTTERTDIEWDLDYDVRKGRIAASNVFAEYRQGNFFSGISHSRLDAPGEVVVGKQINPVSDFNQFRLLLGYGNPGRRGLSVAANGGLDFRLGSVQYSAVQSSYNWSCCGVSVEYRRFALGSVRNENQYRFNFTLAGVGTAGNLRRAERLF